MTGDVLYCLGTAIQLVAFCYGMRPSTLGWAIMIYGFGLALVSQKWEG